MHFITGGAFNGKRKWALNHYHVTTETALLLSLYKIDDSIGYLQSRNSFTDLSIVEGLEYLILNLSKLDSPREEWSRLIGGLEEWEREKEDRKLILIGSDITRGIVPTRREEREWRDLVGFCYQDLVNRVKRVDLIWYGINQILKMS